MLNRSLIEYHRSRLIVINIKSTARMAKNKIPKTEFDNEMKQFISLVKKHEQVPDMEIEEAWANVKELSSAGSIEKDKKKTLRYVLAGLSVAASIAILFFISIPYNNQLQEESSFLTELEKVAPIDSLNQIYLVLSKNKQVTLENEAYVNYDKEGGITVNNQSPEVAEDLTNGANNLNHIIVPKGKRTHITLSDGTKMYVNAASHVIYPSIFNDDKREIAVEGEVFLEVAHNPKVPFIVKTKGLDVKVLGTVFNVTAYEADDISVVLVNGRVEVNSSAKEKMILNPSQMANWKDGMMKKEKVDVTKYICWKDNVMLLELETVSKVLDNLSRYYGVPIWYDKNIADRKLSGKLDLCESIDEVLEIVKISASLNVEKINGGGYHFYK